MTGIFTIKSNVPAAALLTISFASTTFSQAAAKNTADSSGMLWYGLGLIGIVSLIGLLLWGRRKKSSAPERSKSYSGEIDSLDVDEEMEWLRKQKNGIVKRKKKNQTAKWSHTDKISKDADDTLATAAFKQKIKDLQYTQLPINSFSELRNAKPFDLLPLSDDEALMSAIEQTQDEFEEDEQVRDLALRILAAFRTRNSVESLSQIALYDLSVNLRSKAVNILTEFDHESVFEAILLACADPTREVRAAAARGLFRLSFDRADAWIRIAETRDEFRMRQAARAAIEADIVARSLDRLIHEDLKIAHEAFALVALLIKSGETEQIFAAVRNHQNTDIRCALLHVLKVVKDESTLPQLHELQQDRSLHPELLAKVEEVIQSFELVAA